MNKQEMATSLPRAAAFLSEIHQLTYYSILAVLLEMQDNLLKDEKGQVEAQGLGEVIRNLSHQQDLKLTFSNGFHVNTAVTASERLNIDTGCHSQDYEGFLQCA